jgi:hypothetical protein
MIKLNYEIKHERILVQSDIDENEMREYPYILIYDKSHREYIICNYTLYYEENLEIIWFIDIQDDYNYLTDSILGIEIEIIGFLETIPYNYEHEENIMYKREYEKELIEKLNDREFLRK